MTVQKIYKSLTNGELGVYKEASVDFADGKIKHVLIVDGEEKEITESTFKRWWKLVEETTQEDLEESLSTLKEIKDVVLTKEPTIEDLKQLNDSGAELTEEELEMFKPQTVIEAEFKELSDTQPEETDTQKDKPKKKELKVNDNNDLAKYFEQAAVNKGCTIKYYTEPNKRVIKYNNKNVFFYYVYSNNSVGILYKYEIDDELIPTEIKVADAPKHDNPYKFLVKLQGNTEQSKQFIDTLVDSLV